MIFSINRAMAIFQKDVKDVSKNVFVGTTLLVPILMAIVYKNIGEVTLEIHYTVINLTFSSVAAFVQCTLIAEEKEKNTLRSLMLSPATTLEILGGKSVLTALITLLTIIISAVITGYTPSHLFIIVIALLISCLFYLALGTLLGLMTSSVMEASVAVLPVMFLFGFGTLLQQVSDKYPVLSVVDYLPNLQLLELAKKVEDGASFSSLSINLIIILIAGVLFSALVFMIYKKRTLRD
ncbi:ABC transporter permease [Exiguobacterium sp. 17-1]|uniref:ABC transporter permease n=1 Tax=Exiguobacterium sp. 17-1 TaxID=2931981 RepID=UPI0020005487|nr:ABC transporter permease [Exiguobacterium sp. 17-1]MCK2157704.1 ABC transporter permease [Exiguobacterium sp. 17-1]